MPCLPVAVPRPRRLMPGVLSAGTHLVQSVASLLLAVMHHDQQDEALAANAVRALAQLCHKTRGKLIQHLVSQLPLQLFRMGLGRLPALNSGLQSTASALPDWLEEFLRFFIRITRSLHVTYPRRFNKDGVHNAVLEALTPCACSMAHSAAGLLSAGLLDQGLVWPAAGLLTQCAAEIPSRSRTQCTCWMLPRKAPSIAALTRSAAALVVALVVALESRLVTLSPSLLRECSTLLAAVLAAGAQFAAAQCGSPRCQQRTRSEPTDAAPCPAGSSASVMASDASSSQQQLQQAVDRLRIGTCSANALISDNFQDDLRTTALQALALLHGSGAIRRAAAAAASSGRAAPAVQVSEAVAESPPRATVAVEAPAPVETAPGLASARISMPAAAASAQASASPLASQRLKLSPATQQRTAGGGGSHPKTLQLDWARTSFIRAAGFAAKVCAQRSMAGIPHLTVLGQLEVLLGSISDVIGDSCGWCGGPGPSHYEALLGAPACALQWLRLAGDDLPEVCCPSS